MKNRTRELDNVLAAHADNLNAGGPAGPVQPADPAVQPLLTVAERVHHVLRPVEPRPAFVARLKAQLQPGERPALAAAQPRPKSSLVWVGLAGLGGLVSVASAILIVIRLFSGNARRVSAPFKS